MDKPWGGRFSEETDSFVEEFTESVSFDRELALQDIALSRAHARSLKEAGVMSKEELEKVLKSLDEIEREIKEGRFNWRRDLEDVHMNIERRLTELAGPAGAKIHTARSRNDQIATDERLYLREKILSLLEELGGLRRTLVKRAEESLGLITPSYTHLQRAQPIRLAHYFLAFREMFLKDTDRLVDFLRRLDELPLGSGAVAGVDFAIDRFTVARELGFSRISRNSLQATSDRDFILEALFISAQIGLHLSRLAEDLILWSTEEFGFVSLPDSLCTGSSIMPQKKNPDLLELVRGKTGRLIGNLVSLMVVLKGLPTAYNRDLQEDKEPLFDSLRTLDGSLKALRKILDGLEFNEERLKASAGGFTLITDLANYLVRKGLPFRKAHEIAGKITAYLLEKGKKPEDLSLQELRTFSDLFDKEALELMSPERSADMRISFGGTAREEVIRRLDVAKREEGIS